jgi:hypothetical protein
VSGLTDRFLIEAAIPAMPMMMRLNWAIRSKLFFDCFHILPEVGEDAGTADRQVEPLLFVLFSFIGNSRERGIGQVGWLQ